MIKIAIVEDQKQDCEVLTQLLYAYSEEYSVKMDIMAYSAGEVLLDSTENYDIIFMDIQMEHMNGIETSAEIRRTDEKVLIVLVTSMLQYAVQGYSVSANDFIVKPVVREQLYEHMNKLISKVRKNRRFVTIQTRQERKKYKISEIWYFEVLGHKMYLCTAAGKEEFKGTLKGMEEELDGTGFVKCNKCYLVNLAHVKSIMDNQVQVGENFLQISRREKKNFLEAFTRFDGGI